MASLCDGNGIGPDCGRNHSFLGRGEGNQRPFSVFPALPSNAQFHDQPARRTSRRTFTHITLLGKTNIDTDRTANNDGRLFLLPCACVQAGVGGGSRLRSREGWCQIPAGPHRYPKGVERSQQHGLRWWDVTSTPS